MRIHHLIGFIGTLLTAGLTYAATDFESTPNFLSNDPSTNFDIDGLSFNASSYYGVQNNLFITSNPGKYLVYFAGGTNTLDMTYSPSFDLKGFTFGPSENVSVPDSILLTGYLFGGGSISKLLSFSQGASLSFDEASLVGFRGLSHVVFGSLSNNAGYAWIDNIQVSAVPEPGAALMLLSGLGLLALRRPAARSTCA